MICLIAGNEMEAETWARGQGLRREEWFYPNDAKELLKRENFHVIVVGNVMDVQIGHFERLYSLALQRGRINRG